MKHIALTGATGFVGGALATALAAVPHLSVTAILRRPVDLPVPALEADLTNAESVAAALLTLRPDVIVHAAGRVRGSPGELFTANTVTTAVLADVARRVVPEAVLIVIGSAAEYGAPHSCTPLAEASPLRPVSAYGHGKVAAEAYLATLAEQGLKHSWLRVFNLVHWCNTPAQVIGAFIARAAPLSRDPAPHRIEMGRLDAIRDFVTLEDLAAVIVALIDRGDWGHVLNVCSGEGRRVRDLILYLAERAGGIYTIVEKGAPVLDDIVIGDPARVRAVTGIRSWRPIEPVLADAWDRAVIGAGP